MKQVLAGVYRLSAVVVFDCFMLYPSLIAQKTFGSNNVCIILFSLFLSNLRVKKGHSIHWAQIMLY
jgi:hypothetical protein